MGDILMAMLLLVSLRAVKADYECVCNYNVETPVYSAPSTGSPTVGYMYEFDCKPKASDRSTPVFSGIQFENQVGTSLPRGSHY